MTIVSSVFSVHLQYKVSDKLTTMSAVVSVRDLHGKLDGNLIGENPTVAVGRIASRPAGDKTRIATLRYGPVTNGGAFDDKF